MKEGILVINKPEGFTSHDVVAKVRKRFSMKKVGHAGTLDPLATGVLIMLLGRCTKLFDQFAGMDKAYRSTMLLGTKTDTADVQGKILEERTFDGVTKEDIEMTFEKYRGDIKQLPPMYSAVKHKGRKLYEWARKGITVEREPRDVRVGCLEMESFQSPYLKFYMECSKGTYVRQLAEDIGDDLGCGACISQIQRVKVGEFTLDQAVTIEEFNEGHIRNWQG